MGWDARDGRRRRIDRYSHGRGDGVKRFSAGCSSVRCRSQGAVFVAEALPTVSRG